MLDARHGQRISLIEWLPILGGVALLYVPVLFDLATSTWQEDEYAHGPIVLAVFIWLIWDKRQSLFQQEGCSAQIPGLSVVVIGLLIYVIGRSQDVTALQVAALLPILAGILVAMCGWAELRKLWFALLFLVFLIPIPGIALDAVTGPLKQHVSAIAAQALYIIGYPVARSGVVITIGQYQLLVADACSGLNSMLSLTAVGFVYLYLVHRGSWLHNGFVIATLLPIAFFANIVRVIFLVLITYHFGDSAGQGFLHGFSGMVLFVVALVIIFTLDTGLARFNRPSKPA